MSTRAVVEGIGHAVPKKILTNHDLEKLVATDDEWIQQRTGIVERHICSEGESTSSLSTIAAKMALEDAKTSASDIDMVICGTVTPDMLFPASANLVQHAIGATKAGAFDVGAACAGFIYSLAVATAMIESKQIKKAVVIGVDTLSNLVDWTDRSTCVLFGDGAGAVVLGAEEDTDRGVITSFLASDGSGAKYINLEAGGSLHPMCNPKSASKKSTIYMSGAEVFRFAVNAMGDACCKALEQANMTPDDIDLFVPHQANLRIIDSAAKRLNLPPERVFVNVQKYGNTSGGSIPLALSEAVKEGKLKKDMVVLTVGFGAGLVWGANLIRW